MGCGGESGGVGKAFQQELARQRPGENEVVSTNGKLAIRSTEDECLGSRSWEHGSQGLWNCISP